MGNDLRTVAVFQDLTSAEFCESLLEENGIPAHIPNEHTVGLKHPDFWVTLGNVAVQVMPEDAERARDLLEEATQDETPKDAADASEAASEKSALEPPAIAPDFLDKVRAYGVVVVLPSLFVLFLTLTPWLSPIQSQFPSRKSIFFTEFGTCSILLLFAAIGASCLFHLYRRRMSLHARLNLAADQPPDELYDQAAAPPEEESAAETADNLGAVRYVARLATLAAALILMLWLYGVLSEIVGYPTPQVEQTVSPPAWHSPAD
jgi:hypothetical protein